MDESPRKLYVLVTTATYPDKRREIRFEFVAARDLAEAQSYHMHGSHPALLPGAEDTLREIKPVPEEVRDLAAPSGTTRTYQVQLVAQTE